MKPGEENGRIIFAKEKTLKMKAEGNYPKDSRSNYSKKNTGNLFYAEECRVSQQSEFP
jgi:hypothetical protein